jgi:dTDP-4-dehydrorhamnose 3,5-epimerase-like enzyme
MNDERIESARPPAFPGAGRLDLVRWIELPSHRDERGVLTAAESDRDLPFALQRVYFIHDTIAERGGHAHRDTHQVVIAAAGRCEIRLSDGREEQRFILHDIRRGLYIVPMLFIRLCSFTPGSVLVSLASTHYDCTRSLRSWDHYLEAIR